jgi:hypothetical protein
LKGAGAGTFELLSNRDPQRLEFVRDAHSLYFEALAEVGLPGVLLLLVGLGSLAFAAVRAPVSGLEPSASGVAAGLAAALVVFCIVAGVDWLWESTALTVTALTAGALAAAAARPRDEPGRRPRLEVRINGSFLALLLLAVQVPPLVGANLVRDSERAVRENRPESALSSASDATSVEPWGPAGYLQRALVLERWGQLDQAAADAKRAAEREPTNWQPWLILARIEAERGRSAAAASAFRRSRALNPTSPVFARRSGTDR